MMSRKKDSDQDIAALHHERAELNSEFAEYNRRLSRIRHCMERTVSILAKQALGDEGFILEPLEDGSAIVPVVPGAEEADEPCVLPSPATIARLLSQRRILEFRIREIDDRLDRLVHKSE